MATMIEERDVSSALVPPTAVDQGAYIESLRDNAGFLLGTVDKIAEKFFQISLIEQFVKPMAGDWTALAKAQGGWLNLGAALDAGGGNVASGAKQLAPLWEGEASTQATARLHGVAELHASQAEGCRTLAEQLNGIMAVAKTTGELIASMLSMVNDFLMRLAVQAAVPVVGWITGAFDVAAHAAKFWMWVNKMLTAIQKLITVINKVMQVIALVQRVFSIANQTLATATQAVDAYGATYMDDTSRAQFGVG